jgi:hypothetical protein
MTSQSPQILNCSKATNESHLIEMQQDASTMTTFLEIKEDIISIIYTPLTATIHSTWSTCQGQPTSQLEIHHDQIMPTFIKAPQIGPESPHEAIHHRKHETNFTFGPFQRTKRKLRSKPEPFNRYQQAKLDLSRSDIIENPSKTGHTHLKGIRKSCSKRTSSSSLSLKVQRRMPSS